MDAKPAREQPVAIGIVQHITGFQTRSAQGSCDNAAPVLKVSFGVTDDRWLARGARRRMNPRDLVAGDGKHPEGIVIPQVGFDGEREFGQIAQALQIIGMHACFIKAFAIKGHVVIGVTQGPFQTVKLQRADLVPAGDLNRVKAVAGGGEVFHGVISSSKCWPLMVRDRPRNSAMMRPSSPVTVTS